jgi:hypothetical protein
MIRHTAAASIAAMSAADDWTTLAVHNEAPLPSLLLFLFPACSALVVGALYWDGRRARADGAKLQPWRKWGKSLSIGYCGGLLSLQGVLIVRSLSVDMPLDLSAIGRAGGILLAIMCILAINQIFAPGGTWGRSTGHGTCELNPEFLSCS